MDNGASTNIFPPRLAKASNTALVLPVPGSEVIKHLGLEIIKSVVALWCAYGLGIFIFSICIYYLVFIFILS